MTKSPWPQRNIYDLGKARRKRSECEDCRCIRASTLNRVNPYTKTKHVQCEECFANSLTRERLKRQPENKIAETIQNIERQAEQLGKI